MADRLLDHYTNSLVKSRGLRLEDAEALRAEIDADPAWQSRLGRTGGEFERLRALTIAGIATADERNLLNEFA